MQHYFYLNITFFNLIAMLKSVYQKYYRKITDTFSYENLMVGWQKKCEQMQQIRDYPAREWAG
jgi:hypothetical protein